MKFKFTYRFVEIAVSVSVVMAVYSIPFLDYPENDLHYNKKILEDWLSITPWIVLFFFNIEFLIPKLLLKKARLLYFLNTFFAITLISLISFSFNYKKPHFPPQPRVEEFRPVHPPPNKLPLHPPQKKPLIWILNYMLISTLVVGFGTAIKVTSEWYRNEKARKELEHESLKSELAFLRTQVSPHFFLNTLNNIHALTEINVKESQKAIRQLSQMMRYLLYDSEKGTTTLSKEIEFLKSYIDLMKLRIAEDVNINIHFQEISEDIKIPPLLFISFIENAFKHGISYQHKSFIEIQLKFDLGHIKFNCINSLFKSKDEKEESSGIGLKNIKKRLDLIYENKYELNIQEKAKEFIVELIIPADANKMSRY